MERSEASGVKLPCRDDVCHLFPDGCIPRPPLVLYGLPVHADLDAPGEPAAPALVAVCLVYHAALPLAALTAVLSAPPDGSLEEARTAVTREYPVVLPGGEVTAHLARHVVQDPTAGVAHVVRGLRELK